MPKKYIVGIDFGHLNTVAWIAPLTDNGWMKPEGESLKLRAINVVNDRVIDSVVYNTADGAYSLIPQQRTNIIGKMKSRVSDLRRNPYKMEAYKAYIKLVVEALIELNPQLKLDDGDGQPNFLLGMAYPASWNMRDKEEYHRLFNDSVAGLGVCFDWIISESDAVYYSIPPTENEVNNGVSVAIHYGTNSLDFTVMHQGKKISNEDWSSGGLGANVIEREILNSYRKNDHEGFMKAYSENKKLLAEKGCDNINLDEALNDKIRRLKEEAYSEKFDRVFLDLHLYHLTGDPSFRQHRFEYEFSLNEVTEWYRGAVAYHLEHLCARVKDITGRKADSVICEGLPVCMPWFITMISCLFPKARIYGNSYPCVAVARGIALYGASLMKASKTVAK